MSRNHTEDLKCSICSRKFKSKDNLKRHQSTEHGDGDKRSVFQCTYDNCSKEYLYEKNLKCHIRVDHEGQRFSCPTDGCNSLFRAKITLKRHIKNAHGSDSNKKTEEKPSNVIRKPRKDKGCHKTSVAMELSGIQHDQLDVKQTKDIIMKSGKVRLSADALSNEILKSCIPHLESEVDENLGHESSDVESLFDSKSTAIPDLLIPMRVPRLSKTDDEEEVVEKIKCVEHVRIPEKFDFSHFLVDKREI